MTAGFHPVQTLSPKGFALVRSLAHFRSTAVPTAAGTWVVGWGHTGELAGGPVTAGTAVTVEQAEGLLRADVLAAEIAVREHITRPLKQCEFDALVSYEVSGARLRGSMLRLLLNALAPSEQCAREFLKAVYVATWVEVASPSGEKRMVKVQSISKELQHRRVIERDYFLGRR